MVKTETRLQTKLSKAPAVKIKAPLMAPRKNESLKGNVRGNGLGHSCLSGSCARSTQLYTIPTTMSEHKIKDRVVKDQPS
eukprot:13241774-Ditylum_brightwellii.AAC.1